MNFVFLSPAFPKNYDRFCYYLKQNGIRVLGIGDTPYDMLSDTLKEALTEYYRVDNLEDYDAVLRAVGYFTFRYGKIDWLESNNEYWLEQDARLRSDFNISTGFKTEDMDRVKRKSAMKAYYHQAMVPTARLHKVGSLEEGLAFVRQVGYPVIVKPDNGVGASDTYKLEDQQQLEAFYDQAHETEYVMEEFIYGEICSYDAIVDSHGEPLFETGNITPISIMDCVNNKSSVYFYIVKELAEDIRDAGRRCLKAFQVKSRFIHFEFFRLLEDKEGIGPKGTIAGLEVNMRPCGGFTPDMINYAASTDVYQCYADMVAYDRLTLGNYPKKYYCVYIGRRKERNYLHSQEEIRERYQGCLEMTEKMPAVLAAGMGDWMAVAKFPDMEQLNEFVGFALAERTD